MKFNSGPTDLLLDTIDSRLVDILLLLVRMPMLKEYADNIVKWIHPPPQSQYQGWRWGSQDVWDNYYTNLATREREWGYKTEPTLKQSANLAKPGENVFDSRNCFGLVFGWTSVETLEIPYLNIKNLDKRTKISKKSFPMKCFIVFVGGKFVRNVDSVVERAEEISEELYISRPSMYIFESKFGKPTISTKTDFPMVHSFICIVAQH